MKDQAGPVASEFLAKGVEAGTVVATGSRVLGAGAGALTNWVIGKTFSSMAAEFSVDVEAQLLENVRASRDYASTDDTAAAEILDDLLATPESEAVLQQGFWYRMQLIDTAVHPALTLLVADYATERIGPDNFFRQAGRLLSNLRRAELVALRMVFEQYLDLLQPGLTGAGVYSDRAGGFVGQPGINQQHDTPLMDLQLDAFVALAHSLKEARLGADPVFGTIGGVDPTTMVRFTSEHLATLKRLRRYVLVPPARPLGSEVVE